MGGAERVILTLAQGLQHAGRLTVAAPEGPLLQAARALGVAGVPVGFDRMRAAAGPAELLSYLPTWRRCSRQLLDFCRSGSVDLIHAHHPVGVLYALPAARRLHIPVILHVHEAPPVDRRYRMALRAISRIVDRYVCVSDSARALLDSAGIRGSAIHTVPNGVDWLFLEQTPGRPKFARPPWGAGWAQPGPGGLLPPATATPEVAGDGPHVGVFAVLEPRKGQDHFLRAAMQVLRRHPTACFWVVGGLVLEDKAGFLQTLRTMADRPPLRGHVRFVGHRDDVWRWMAAMDVVCLTSVAHESIGMVLLEAMALGRTVVGTRIGEAGRLIDDGVCGFLADPGDAGSLADAIGRALAADRQSIGARAAAVVRARYAPGRFCDRIEAVYDTLSR
ncbi:MAG: glycosyltransferase [Lautropia sp.]